jgi:hypothetical protein
MQSITITDYDYPWNQVKLLLNIESPLSPWYIETPIHGISILYHGKLNPFLTKYSITVLLDSRDNRNL